MSKDSIPGIVQVSRTQYCPSSLADGHNFLLADWQIDGNPNQPAVFHICSWIALHAGRTDLGKAAWYHSVQASG